MNCCIKEVNSNMKMYKVPGGECDYQHWYQNIPGHEKSVVILLDEKEISHLIAYSSMRNIDVSSVITRLREVKFEFPWFVRLTSRSPKDISDCKACSIEDGIKMICESQRTMEDLVSYLDSSEEIGIVIQPWNHMINPQEELRLFVHNNNLVAISAVDEPNKGLSSDDIELIKTYITKLKINYTEYVADMCYIHSTHEIIFIEVNPYNPEITDSILFEWEVDKDILFSNEPNPTPVYRFE